MSKSILLAAVLLGGAADAAQDGTAPEFQGVRKVWVSASQWPNSRTHETFARDAVRLYGAQNGTDEQKALAIYYHALRVMGHGGEYMQGPPGKEEHVWDSWMIVHVYPKALCEWWGWFLIDLWNVRLSAAYPDDPRGVAATLEALAERALDHGCLGPARLGFHLVAYLRWGVGLASDAARTMRHAEQVSRGTEGRDRVVALAEAAVCLGRLERDLGDAEALALEARAMATRAGLEVAALPMAFGLLRAHRGELDQAARDYRDAWAIAHRARDRLDEFAALEQMVMLALRRGRLEEARADAAELLGLGDRLRDGSDGPCARALAATVSYAGGPAPADVDADADAALAELRSADAKQRLGFALLSVAEVDLERGRFAAARARAGEALELAHVMSLPTDQAWARLVLARAAAGAGDEAAHRAEVAALGGSDLALVAAPIRAQVTAHLARHGGGRP